MNLLDKDTEQDNDGLVKECLSSPVSSTVVRVNCTYNTDLNILVLLLLLLFQQDTKSDNDRLITESTATATETTAETKAVSGQPQRPKLHSMSSPSPVCPTAAAVDISYSDVLFHVCVYGLYL